MLPGVIEEFGMTSELSIWPSAGTSNAADRILCKLCNISTKKKEKRQ